MTNFLRQNQGIPSNDNLADITVVTGRIDNVESGLVGNLSLASIDINGGTIDGTTVGATTPSTGEFTNLEASTLTATASFVASATVDIGTTLVVTGSATIASGITCTEGLVVGSGIATAGNEALKMDIILGTESVATVTTDSISVAHGKGANIRGACATAYASTGAVFSAGADSANATNVNLSVTNGSIGTNTVSYAITVFYI